MHTHWHLPPRESFLAYPRDYNLIQNEEGKKAGDLEGHRGHESANGREWMGAVRWGRGMGFAAEGDAPDGFSTHSQVKGTT